MYGSSCKPEEIASLPHIQLLYLICYVFSKSIKFPILMWPKKDVPNLVTYLIRTSIFEWYVVRCGFKNEHQKDVSQEMITILGSIGNNMEGPIWPFNEHKNLHFDNEEDIHVSSKNYEESGYSLNLDLLAISY